MSAQPHVHDHDSAEGLRSVEDARAAVLDRIQALDLPEFASSAMDGFAVRASDVAGATPVEPGELAIVGRAAIGHEPDGTVGAGEAMWIATGAPIPGGADVVVPIENAVVDDDEQRVRLLDGPAPGTHVRLRGEDVREGDVLVPAGKRLGAPELGLLANSGHPTPLVHPRPRVVVLSTGDELIAPTESPSFGQVRDANAYTIFGALREMGAMPVMAGIVRDDVDSLRETIFSFEIQADAFVSSGGVSVGERDVVKAAFFRRGDVDFYKVAMQPGMPQGFGHVEGKPYFGLPGNPVSVFVSLEVFVRPAILKMMGRRHLFRPEITATLTQDVRGPRGKLQYARVEVRRTSDGWSATPTGARGSNLISTVAKANGLAMIPAGTEVAEAGSSVRVMLFRSSGD
jgi:molybdopterin molybdotransferase